MELPQKTKDRVSHLIQCPIPTPKYISKGTEIRTISGECSPMFTAAFFITAKILKQPKCPSADERISNMRHIVMYISV